MARRKKHPGSIEKRGDSYRIRLCVAGARSYHTLANVTREEAEEFARTKHEELKAQAKRHALGLPGAVPFSELVDRFERDELPTLSAGTQRSYRESFKPLRQFFEQELDDPLIDRIQAAHVKQFMAWRRTHGPSGEERREPLSGRTIEKDRAVLHRLFEIADQLELREGNPVARTEPPRYDRRDPVILSTDQYEALLTACEGRDMLYVYVLFLGETGARSVSEALWVRWEDLDLEESFVWLDSSQKGHRTKSGKGRWCPLTPRLVAALREHAAKYRLQTHRGKRSPWVFHHPHRRRRARAGDRIKSMRHAVSSAAERAKLPEEWVKHDLRHRRVTTWLAEGKNPVHVKEAMGHSDLRITMAYTHLSREHLRGLVDDEDDGGVQGLVADREKGRITLPSRVVT